MASDPGPALRPGRHVRLRVSSRSILAAVAILGLGFLAWRLFAAAVRPLGWVVVATLLAGLLHPVVSQLRRYLPGWLAVVIVSLTLVGVVSLVTYGVVDDLRLQANRLERVLPDAARELEKSDRFGEAAREFELADKVQAFVDEIPDRLRGGSPEEALRAAATRGVAFLATAVLTLFLLTQGPRLVSAGFAQIAGRDRREQLQLVLTRAYGRSWRYLTLTLCRAVLAGLFTGILCQLADIPGATLLGIWVAAWSLVPVVGVLVGSLAVVFLAVLQSGNLAVSLLIVFVAYQVAEVLAVERWVERHALRVGPFLTFVPIIVGLELYGVGGAVVAFVLAVVALAVVDGFAPEAQPDHEPVARPVAGPDPSAAGSDAGSIAAP